MKPLVLLALFLPLSLSSFAGTGTDLPGGMVTLDPRWQLPRSLDPVGELGALGKTRNDGEAMASRDLKPVDEHGLKSILEQVEDEETARVIRRSFRLLFQGYLLRKEREGKGPYVTGLLTHVQSRVKQAVNAELDDIQDRVIRLENFAKEEARVAERRATAQERARKEGKPTTGTPTDDFYVKQLDRLEEYRETVEEDAPIRELTWAGLAEQRNKRLRFVKELMAELHHEARVQVRASGKRDSVSRRR